MPELKRGFMETLKGGIAIIVSMLYDRFAAQEVADERAQTCLGCPLNTFYDDPTFATWCNDRAEDCVGDRKSKYHDELGVCEACTCGLRFKVFYDHPIKLTKQQKAKMQAANKSCWQVKECQT